MNKSQLARALNVAPQMITNWIKRGMPTDWHEKAADVLGCSVDELLGRVNSQPTDDEADELLRLFAELETPGRTHVLQAARIAAAAQGQGPDFSTQSSSTTKVSVPKSPRRAVRGADLG